MKTKQKTSAKESVGKKIMEGLREFTEALENNEPIAEKFTCRKVSLDLYPVPCSPKAVKSTRKLLMVSQPMFAQFLGVSVKTIRAWEQGKTTVGDMACRFLDEIRRNPEYWRKRLKESVRIKDAC